MKPIKDIQHLQTFLANGAMAHTNSQDPQKQPRPCIFIPFTAEEQQHHVDQKLDTHTMRQHMEKQVENSGLRSIGVTLYQEGKVGPNPTTDELITALNGVDEARRKEILQQAVLETPYIVEYNGSGTHQAILPGTTVIIAGHGDGTVPYIASGHGMGTCIDGQTLIARMTQTSIPENIGAISLQTCGGNLKFYKDIRQQCQSYGQYAQANLIAYGLPQENSSLYIQTKPLQKLDLGMQNIVTKDGSAARHDLVLLRAEKKAQEQDLDEAKENIASAKPEDLEAQQMKVATLEAKVRETETKIAATQQRIAAANIRITHEHTQAEYLAPSPVLAYLDQHNELPEFNDYAELQTFLQDRSLEMLTPQDVIYIPFSPEELGDSPLMQQAMDIQAQTTLRKLATDLYQEYRGQEVQTTPWTEQDLVDHLNASDDKYIHLHEALRKTPIILQYDPNSLPPENPLLLTGTVHILAKGEQQSDLIRTHQSADKGQHIDAAELVRRLQSDQMTLPRIQQIKLQVDGGRGAFHQSLLQQCQDQDFLPLASLTSYGIGGQDSTLTLTHDNPLQDLHLGNRSVSPPDSPQRQAQVAKIADLQQSLTKAQERLGKLQEISLLPKKEQDEAMVKMMREELLQIMNGHPQGLPEAEYLTEHIMDYDANDGIMDIDLLDQKDIIYFLKQELAHQPALETPSPAKGNKVRDLFKRQSAPSQGAGALSHSQGH